MPAVTKTLQNDALDMIKGTLQGDLIVEVANLTPGRPHGDPPGCPLMTPAAGPRAPAETQSVDKYPKNMSTATPSSPIVLTFFIFFPTFCMPFSDIDFAQNFDRYVIDV